MTKDMNYPSWIPLAVYTHPASINSFAVPHECENSDWHYILTACEDGILRKFDFYATINGKSSATAVQRQGLVDSVCHSGYVVASWRNYYCSTEASDNELNRSIIPSSSIAQSLALDSNYVFGLAGLQNGKIELFTVRLEPGRIHHTFGANSFEGAFRNEPSSTVSHSDIVTALCMPPNIENPTSFTSCSWDKSIINWDLNTGNHIRNISNAHKAPISNVCYHPDGNLNILLSCSYDGTLKLWDFRAASPTQACLSANTENQKDQLSWILDCAWSTDGSKVFAALKNESVGEYQLTYAPYKLNRSYTYKLPHGSGAVSSIETLNSDNNFFLCGSFDNIRQWNILDEKTKNQNRKTPSFFIVPGHHSGSISKMAVHKSDRYMISTSGNCGVEGASSLTATNQLLFYTDENYLNRKELSKSSNKNE